MVNLDKSFSPIETTLLKGLEGRVLLAVGYVPVSDNVGFGRIRLYFADESVDIGVRMCGVDYTGDGEMDDDEAFMFIESVGDGMEAVSEIDGDECRIEYDKVVKSVLVAQDHVISRQDGIESFELVYPQAVLLDFGGEFLCVDKQDGPWEMMNVKSGESPSELVFDCSGEWENSPDEAPGLCNEFNQEIVAL